MTTEASTDRKDGRRKTGPRAAGLVGAVAVSAALLGACVPAVPWGADGPDPVACAYSAYPRAAATLPDGLAAPGAPSDRACGPAPGAMAYSHDPDGHDHLHGWWMGSGLLMALMMVTMWSRW